MCKQRFGISGDCFLPPTLNANQLHFWHLKHDHPQLTLRALLVICTASSHWRSAALVLHCTVSTEQQILQADRDLRCGPHSTLLQEFQQRLLWGWRGSRPLVIRAVLWMTDFHPWGTPDASLCCAQEWSVAPTGKALFSCLGLRSASTSLTVPPQLPLLVPILPLEESMATHSSILA